MVGSNKKGDVKVLIDMSEYNRLCESDKALRDGKVVIDLYKSPIFGHSPHKAILYTESDIIKEMSERHKELNDMYNELLVEKYTVDKKLADYNRKSDTILNSVINWFKRK